MHRAALAVLLLTALVAGVCPANAHVVTPAPAGPAPAVPPLVVAAVLHEAITAAPADPGAPWAAVALLTALSLAAVSRRRRVVAVALIAVIALLAFEAGVHSTHHLGKADDAAQCIVASVSAQLSADVSGVPVPAAVALAPTAVVLVLATPVVAIHGIAPDVGRAPPAFPS